MTRLSGSLTFAILLCALPLAAQDCPMDVDIGDFNVTYETAVYDGASTEFTYCITGLDNPDFHALSHWDMEMETDCVSEDNLVACSPEPCYFQLDDPTTGITGIKFDDLEVDKGETECFSFTLDGDWTNLIDDVTIGLKASTEVYYGAICGPHCRSCVATLEIIDQESDPKLSLFVGHNRPPTVLEVIRVTVTNERGRTIERSFGPFKLGYGAERTFVKRLAEIGNFAPGTYTLTVHLETMYNVHERTTTFVIP